MRQTKSALCSGGCLENQAAVVGTVLCFPPSLDSSFLLFWAGLALLLRLLSAEHLLLENFERKRRPRRFIGAAAPYFQGCSFAFFSHFLSLHNPFQPFPSSSGRFFQERKCVK